MLIGSTQVLQGHCPLVFFPILFSFFLSVCLSGHSHVVKTSSFRKMIPLKLTPSHLAQRRKGCGAAAAVAFGTVAVWRARHLNVWREGGGGDDSKNLPIHWRREAAQVFGRCISYSSPVSSCLSDPYTPSLFVAALSPQTVGPSFSSSLSNCCCRLFCGGRRASHLLLLHRCP